MALTKDKLKAGSYVRCIDGMECIHQGQVRKVHYDQKQDAFFINCAKGKHFLLLEDPSWDEPSDTSWDEPSFEHCDAPQIN